MPEKVCTKCGRLNLAHSNFCLNCGAQDFVEAQAEQFPSITSVADTSVLISKSRIMVLSVVTSGLYFLYWLYITWRQLQTETRDIHYPVAHAFTMLIPVYGLFRLHKHVGVIQNLALRTEIEISLTPVLAVVLVGLYVVLGFVSTSLQSLAGLLVLNLIRFSLCTTTMILAQSTLNAYWKKSRGPSVQNAPIGAGETAIILLGFIYWLFVFLSAL
jgi:hypothetical protein